MKNDQEAQAAIAALNDKDFNGRPLKINEAKPREDRPRFNDSRGTPRRAPLGNRI